MLEPVGLVVHVVDVDAERLCEVQLEQAVVADHLERDLLSLRRQRDTAVRRVLDERQGGELLHHRTRGGGRDAHLAGEGRRRDPVARGAELVDLAQVVLDRVAQRSHPRHVASLRRGSRAWFARTVLASRAVDVRVGHSPDPDDAFMYWALTTELLDTRGFAFEQVLADIQTLNQWARAARLEVTAISLAAYPFVQEDYALLPHGASIGAGYGPIVVSREPVGLDDLGGLEIVVPGAMTTAFLTLRLVLGDVALPRARPSSRSRTRWPAVGPRPGS